MTRSRAPVVCSVVALLVAGCVGSDPSSSQPDSGGRGSGGALAGTGGAAIDLPSTSGSGGAAGGADGGVDDAAAPDAPPSGTGGSLVDPGSEGDGDRVIGPNYTADPRLSDPAAPKGTRFSFTMTGAQSQIYKGVNGNYTRNVSVYVPSQYNPAKPAALMVTQDAMGGGELPGLLDNLINKKMLPVIVVIFASSGGGDAVGSERGLEYDTVSGLYAEYAMKEMVPRAIMEAKTHNIDLKFTDDPEGHGVLGGSSGGAGSFSMAWWHPDYFRRIITYSGTYVTQVPAGSPFPHGCWIYHDIDPYSATAPNGLIVASCEPVGGFKGDSNPGPCDTPLSQAKCEAVTGCQWNTKVNRPFRIWHESATGDLGAGGAPSSYRNFDLANQRMAAAFKLRGYHYHYDHALSAGHVDGKAVRQTIVEAMLYVWRGYPIQ
jgi:enterochelin esterase family protein